MYNVSSHVQYSYIVLVKSLFSYFQQTIRKNRTFRCSFLNVNQPRSFVNNALYFRKRKQNLFHFNLKYTENHLHTQIFTWI